jgi:hypothetical protein
MRARAVQLRQQKRYPPRAVVPSLVALQRLVPAARADAPQKPVLAARADATQKPMSAVQAAPQKPAPADSLPSLPGSAATSQSWAGRMPRASVGCRETSLGLPWRSSSLACSTPILQPNNIRQTWGCSKALRRYNRLLAPISTKPASPLTGRNFHLAAAAPRVWAACSRRHPTAAASPGADAQNRSRARAGKVQWAGIAIDGSEGWLWVGSRPLNRVPSV